MTDYDMHEAVQDIWWQLAKKTSADFDLPLTEQRLLNQHITGVAAQVNNRPDRPVGERWGWWQR